MLYRVPVFKGKFNGFIDILLPLFIFLSLLYFVISYFSGSGEIDDFNSDYDQLKKNGIHSTAKVIKMDYSFIYLQFDSDITKNFSTKVRINTDLYEQVKYIGKKVPIIYSSSNFNTVMLLSQFNRGTFADTKEHYLIIRILTFFTIYLIFIIGASLYCIDHESVKHQ